MSYAHVDNAPIEPADHGWVDALVGILERDVVMRLGRKEAFSIWRDTQSLRGNYQISGHIPAQVKNSALFLVVLSPGYLASQYCMQELRAFVERRTDTVEQRIFVICKDPVDETSEVFPPQILDLRKYQFWITDSEHKPRVLGWPLPQNDMPQDRQFYYPKIGDVAADISAKLNELKRASGSNGASISVTPSQNYDSYVLLAEVTDDLDARREEIRRYLNQQGIGTLPTGSYRLDRTEFERSICADLDRCAGFVQLLGPIAGKAPPDVPEGFGRLQFELASKRNIPVLQWRSPELGADEATSLAHRQFLMSASVRAMPFEDFKRNIVEAIVKNEPAKSEKSHFLFVNAAPIDMAQAKAIVSNLDDSLEWEMPLYEADAKAEAIQNEIEPQLVDCDALVVIYGKAGVKWVVSQLQQYRKLAPRRKKDPQLLAVVGETKDLALSIPIKLRGMATFDINEAAKRIKDAFKS
ncbi:MAG: TIR domain-containing protein [Hyphomicrobiales bacterium]|nr:TIR domain-containing protein [Hyphomicrobiales bacterium]MBV8441412.1 TIR domain-containing protein [Hyphomicrobiales bacterium]